MDISQIEVAIYMLVGLILGVIIHEFSHGLMAFWMGDPTAKRAGRLTLDPMAHVDRFGTIILPGMLFLLRIMGVPTFIIGYAKPVPINPFLFKKRRGIIWVSLAGISANLLLALLALGIAKIVDVTAPEANRVIITLTFIAYINVLLAVFNLIPIPPLDGSRVLGYFLRGEALRTYQGLEQYGFFLIFALVMVFGVAFTEAVSSVFNLLARLVDLPFRFL
ncbi:MAG: site-2 protease family protein [Deltaproteobacteria bacterium HGW-Deltaproteobacteria-17]|nr:MAG: site-2 protease family protein [Deltaproteobacteria bacterium HGW-Deltaproteobacteria-17]